MCMHFPTRHSTKQALALVTGQRRLLTNSCIRGNINNKRLISTKPPKTRHPALRRTFANSSIRQTPSNDNKTTNSSKSKYDALKSNPSTASLLDTHVNRAAAGAKIGAGRPGSDGTFYLGIRPGDNQLPKGYKNWKELGVGGKVARTGARATSSFVILAGAGLTALLVYALATELGSRNSPTVIYSDVCELIKEHEGLRHHFPPFSNFKFHTTPPRSSIDRPRHRNRSVPSAVSVDARGREHLYLNFWIEAKEDTVPTWRQLSYWDVRDWDWSISNIRTHAAKARHDVWIKGREMFALLTGEPIAKIEDDKSTSEPQHQSLADSHSKSKSNTEPQAQSIWSSLTGLFTTLRPTAASSKSGKAKERMVFDTGEVHVDLIRDSSNNYSYRYILVDLPNSTGSAPTRIFVKRTAGVREEESVMRFS